MSCDLCRDQNGPFQIIEYKNKCILVCEDCAKKEERKKDKKHEATIVCNKRHAHRISRTDRRSK